MPEEPVDHAKDIALAGADGPQRSKARRNADIIRDRREGATYAELARKYHLSPPRIRDICIVYEIRSSHAARPGAANAWLQAIETELRKD